MKAWLKGGLISLGLVIFIILNGFLFEGSSIKIFGYISRLIGMFDIIGYFACFGICKGLDQINLIYTIPTSYFIYGAIIGWLLEKRKSKVQIKQVAVKRKKSGWLWIILLIIFFLILSFYVLLLT